MTSRLRNIIYLATIVAAVSIIGLILKSSVYKAEVGGGEMGAAGGVAVCSDDSNFKSKYVSQVERGRAAGASSLKSVSLPNYQTYHQVDFRDYLDPKLDAFLSGKTTLTNSDYSALVNVINLTYNEWVLIPGVRDKFRAGVELPPTTAASDVVNSFNYTPNVPDKKYLGFSNPLKFSNDSVSFELEPTSVNWQRLKASGYLNAIDWSAEAEIKLGRIGSGGFECLQFSGRFGGSAELQYLKVQAKLKTRTANISFFLAYNPGSQRGYGNIFPR